MNTYNENQHDTVVTALADLQVRHQTLATQLSVDQVKNDYAQEAACTANDVLQRSIADLEEKSQVRQHAVNSDNISTNVLASAMLAKQHTAISVSDMATAAANVQVAANAAIKLAGDITSIYSIVKAADLNSDLYANAEQLISLIGAVSYDAETASEQAMDASALTAMIISSAVFDQAKSTDTLMKNLVNNITTERNTCAAAVTTNEVSFTRALADAQLACGALSSTATSEKALAQSIAQTNALINLSLQVTVETGSRFNVTFDAIERVFDKPGSNDTNIIKTYYLILVKKSREATFRLENAEGLLSAMPGSLKQLTQVPLTGGKVLTRMFDVYQMKQDDGNPYILADTDGDDIVGGQSYVMFLFTVYTDSYQREINNFENFLSAPSNAFTLIDKKVKTKPRRHAEVAHNKQYGITEQKKAELDELTLKVMQAQNDVGLSQNAVAVLTNKLNNSQTILYNAQTAQTDAQTNRNLVDGLISSANELKQNTKIALQEAIDANKKTQQLASGMAVLINKLTYCAQMLDKFNLNVIKRKTVNPLISDELVSVVGTTGKDANNAVLLMLVALRSTIAAQAASINNSATIGLVNAGSVSFYESLAGDVDNKTACVKYLLHTAYTNAQRLYHDANKTVAEITKQLNTGLLSIN